MTISIPEPRFAHGLQLRPGHAALFCMCRPGRVDSACASLTAQPPCSFAGCAKPTAYLPGPSGFGWRHVVPDDETTSHLGHPFERA